VKIVIDAYQLAPTVTGTDRQARNVLRELQLLDTSNDYVVIVNDRHGFVAEVVAAPNFTLMPLRIERRALWHVVGLPRIIRHQRADVFFSFHNLTSPLVKNAKLVVSALDVIPFLYQTTYFRGFVNRWVRRPLVLGGMKAASLLGDAFLANSQFTKQAIAKRFRIDPDVISVGDLQAEATFFEKHSSERMAEVRAKYRLPENFVFCLGGSEPRKNVLYVITGHHLLPSELQSRFPIVVGGAAWQDTTFPVVDDPCVRHIGFVDDPDLPVVYSMAAVFAYPSEYEGFGLPVLEAMASGTPVLTSNATALPEVVGDAAVMVDPRDIVQIRDGLAKILSDAEFRDGLVARGVRNVARYSWKQNAAVLLETFTRVLKTTPSGNAVKKSVL
jgi:glycosyltransferase involved in cell wall biosynthesis